MRVFSGSFYGTVFKKNLLIGFNAALRFKLETRADLVITNFSIFDSN